MIRSAEATARAAESAEAGVIEVTRHDVPLPGLPGALDGTTLAQISDLHRGRGNTDPVIRAAIEEVNRLDADYVVVTGDFCDGPREDVLPVVRMVSGLRARRQLLATLGNHDHRGDPLLLTAALEAAGFTVLINRAVELAEGFWMAGVDDFEEGNPDLEAAMRGVPADSAAILLAHNPEALDVVDPQRPLLILSGHTHGGQIRLRFPSPEYVCWQHLRTRHVHGWYARGAARLYVNRGVGVTGPAVLARRHNCLPEVGLFRLVSETPREP